MTCYFLTFGGGGEKYIKAGERLIRQANALNLFDKTILYTDELLKKDLQFWDKHSQFIETNPRGYGYWLWKPYIIKKIMEQLNDGDVLLYLDAGCELLPHKREKLKEYIDIVKNDLLIGTEWPDAEKHWNKMDCILKLEMLDDHYLNSHQRQGGTNMFYVCDTTRHLVNKWYEIACDYHIIDDSPSISTNMEGFIDHRHDQAIFSLLTKKYNIYSSYRLDDAIEIVRNFSHCSKFS